MVLMILGGSGSGKSAYAEERILKFNKNARYYIATMQIYGQEEQAKVLRHQVQRAGKGFTTIECPLDVECAAKELPNDSQRIDVLLECMTNLVANEMFREKQPLLAERVADKIMGGIERLIASATHLVIVSGDVFGDGMQYDEMTIQYVRAMGMVNERLALLADEVVEVVAGIPVQVKKGEAVYEKDL